MTALELIPSLTAKSRHPVYFLYGEERFLVSEITSRLTDLLITDDNRDFNLDLFDASTSSPGDWLGAARTMSFLGGDKLVIVKGLDEVTLSDAGLAALLEYIADPVPEACLVLTATKADRKRKVYKALTKLPGSVECTAPKEAGLAPWLKKRAQDMGKTLSGPAAQMMVNRVGPKPGLLAGELEKVITFAGESNKIDESCVAEVVGEMRMENAFALTEALKEKNAQRALSLLRNQLDHGEEPLKMLGMVAWQFRLIWEIKHYQEQRMPSGQIARQMGQKPFVVDKAMRSTGNFSVAQLREGFRHLGWADQELKTTGKDAEGILESLILKLCS